MSCELQLASDIVRHGGVYDKTAIRIVLQVETHPGCDFEVQQWLFTLCRLDELPSRIEGFIASKALAFVQVSNSCLQVSHVALYAFPHHMSTPGGLLNCA